MDIILYLVCSYVFVYALIHAVHFYQVITYLLREKLYISDRIIVDLEDIPADLSNLFSKAELILEDLGFEKVAITKDSNVNYRMICVNKDLKVYSSTDLIASPTDGAPFITLFYTTFEDRKSITSFDGTEHYFLPPDKDTVHSDHFTFSTKEQLEKHIEFVNSVSKKPIIDDISSDSDLLSNTSLIKQYSYNIETGFLKITDSENHYKYTLKGAIKSYFWFRSARREIARKSKTLKSIDRYEFSHEEKAASLKYQYERETKNLNNKKQTSFIYKSLLFAGSIVLFYISFGWMFSWSFVPILLAVLLLHEVGHLLAMKLFKYKDMQMLFIPFLGAAVTGKKEGATASQKIIVSLSGPVPGIIAAICITLFVSGPLSKLQYDFVLMLFIINLLNLLPFYPLDGGRVISELSHSKNHIIKLVLSIVSIITFYLGACFLKDGVLFVLGTALLISLPEQIKSVKVISGLKNGGVTFGESEEFFGKIFKIFSYKKYDTIPLCKKIKLIRQLSDTLTQRGMSRIISWIWGAAYLVMLLVPLLFFIYYVKNISSNEQLPKQQYEEEYSKQWEESVKKEKLAIADELQLARGCEEKWQILFDAGSWASNNEDYKLALDYFKDALSCAKELGVNDIRLPQSLEAVIANSENKPEIESLTKEFVSLIDDIEYKESIEYVKLLDKRSNYLNESELDKKSKILEKAWLIINRQNLGADNLYFIGNVAHKISLVYEDNGAIPQAEQVLLDSYHKILKLNKKNYWVVGLQVEHLVNYYIRADDHAKGIAMIDELLAEYEGFNQNANEDDLLFQSHHYEVIKAWLYSLMNEYNISDELVLKSIHKGGENLSEDPYTLSPMFLDSAYFNDKLGDEIKVKENIKTADEYYQQTYQKSVNKYYESLKNRSHCRVPRLTWRLIRKNAHTELLGKYITNI